jgi:hypothetical protein
MQMDVILRHFVVNHQRGGQLVCRLQQLVLFAHNLDGLRNQSVSPSSIQIHFKTIYKQV